MLGDSSTFLANIVQLESMIPVLRAEGRPRVDPVVVRFLWVGLSIGILTTWILASTGSGIAIPLILSYWSAYFLVLVSGFFFKVIRGIFF
ncbi:MULTISPECIES: hypothetical protein [unclassified Methanoregula]|uniref:hypothetical protein n=1 Tax=unclassified Methanoregula TaxID=2649730 RepID=UPI0009C697C9|nr:MULTISPECIES: hypothetical protein [unclassified Methanoregula]OPX62530.1 MAG: hypothetical protein A4E33_02279 [Methanoregula sp. PtaB.Bin085]OPY31629.1 MAG: hypothetical protein A4E34_02822 [Methanoregula sp. PtaU1.Bin006]